MKPVHQIINSQAEHDRLLDTKQVSEEIEAFVGRLRDRPWIDPAPVDVIACGLRAAARDPDPSLWYRLREVIRDDDLTMADQLERISEVTAARRAARIYAH
jgi:hypothetical protein